MTEIKYIHEPGVHRADDAACIVPAIMESFRPASVLDVGCGLGHFLQAFQGAGVPEVKGIEGEWLDKSQLVIDPEHVIIRDLEQPFSLGRKFDLVLCLEVAEHLTAAAASSLVEALTVHSDVIVFSAAIPGQGGQHHFNEQWIDYWQDLFAKHDFHMNDSIRHRIWNDQQIHWWYRQNIVVCCRATIAPSLEQCPINSYVHPELYAAKVAVLDHYRAWIDRFFTGEVEVEIMQQLLAQAKTKQGI